MKKSLLLTLATIANAVMAQDEAIKPCGTAEIANRYLQNYPQTFAKKEQLENFTKDFSLYKNTEKSGVAKYIIPVIIHIIHNGGTENIADAQVLDQMTILNEDFKMTNADLSGVIADFQGVIADFEIEFRLAKKDPNGNPTTGIERIKSSNTVETKLNAAKINQWPPEKYLNVWVVKDASGNVGYTYFPYLADTEPQNDGIVIRHDAFGKTGTAASATWKRNSMSHEVGHWLNLMHLWGSSNSPGVSTNCNDDDGVTDTPNEVGAYFKCDKAFKSCGTLNMAQNFMTYTFCGVMFTEGQKTRAHAALNSTLAKRNKIWTETNLKATGVDDATYFAELDKKALLYDIDIFPNPASGNININFNNRYNISTFNLSLKNIMGQEVLSLKKDGMASGINSFNTYIGNLTQGIYMAELNLNGENTGIVKKIIIQ